MQESATHGIDSDWKLLGIGYFSGNKQQKKRGNILIQTKIDERR